MKETDKTEVKHESSLKRHCIKYFSFFRNSCLSLVNAEKEQLKNNRSVIASSDQSSVQLLQLPKVKELF